MTDPFSISLGIIALIGTLQELATFLGKVQTAPDTLQKAHADILLTIDVLKDIKHGLETSRSGVPSGPTKSDYDASMSSVLSQCQQICAAFQSKLSSCVSTHTDKAHVLYYWVKTAMKSETIDKFRTDLERSRQLVHMRLQLISTDIANQTAGKVQELYNSNELLVQAIAAQIESLKVSIAGSEQFSEDLQASMKAEAEKHENLLQAQLQMCKDNRTAIEQKAHNTLHFGNTKLGNDSKNFRGLDLDKAKGSIDLKFGDAVIGDGSSNFEGAAGGETISTFFARRTTADARTTVFTQNAFLANILPAYSMSASTDPARPSLVKPVIQGAKVREIGSAVYGDMPSSDTHDNVVLQHSTKHSQQSTEL